MELSRESGVWTLTSSWHLTLVSELDNELTQDLLSRLCSHMSTLCNINIIHVMNVPRLSLFKLLLYVLLCIIVNTN